MMTGKAYTNGTDRCRQTGWGVGMITILLLLWGWGIPALSRADAPLLAEYQVKAAYLFNFLRFIEGPEGASTGNETEAIIGVIGDTPIGEALKTYAGRTVGNRRVVIRKIGRMEEMQGCRMVYVSASEKKRLTQILTYAAAFHVITVSDIKRFIHAGGTIGFVNRREYVRFEINDKAARHAGFHISSHLLSLALTVVE